MSSADSIIRVSIIGDAKKLRGALGDADKGMGGLVKSAATAVAGLAVVKAGFDFAQDSLGEADRLGDAMSRLNISIGEIDAAKLSDTAEDFHSMGLSKQDVLELAANFADLGTNAGIAAPDIATFADDVAATAAAISLLDPEGRDPAHFVDDIGRAAGGNQKALKDLGINIDEAAVAAQALIDTGKPTVDSLTDSELATARLKIILEKLKPKLDDATTGSGDLEQSQRDLQAQVETLQAKLGGPLSDALNEVVGFILDEIDAIPGAIRGWQLLGGAVETFGRTALGPLGNVRDALNGILDLLAQAVGGVGAAGGASRGMGSSDTLRRRNPGGGGVSEKQVVRAVQRSSERVGGIGSSMGGP